MKVLTIFTAVFLVFTLNSFSQNHFLGIQGGVNISNSENMNLGSGSENRIGFVGGLKYELLLSDRFSFAADVLYTQEGSIVEFFLFPDAFGNSQGSEEVKNHLDYIAIPIKIGYSFGKNFRITPRIGVQPAFLVSAKRIGPKFNNIGRVNGEESVDIIDLVPNFEFSGLFEIEFGYNISSNFTVFLSAMGRYSFAEMSMFSIDPKHKSIASSAGLKYRLGKKD